MRGVDRELWKASAHRAAAYRHGRVYLRIVIPILRPTIITASVRSIAVVRVYELVLATHRRRPGDIDRGAGKFIMDYLFGRGNIGACDWGLDLRMFVTVVILVTPVALL